MTVTKMPAEAQVGTVVETTKSLDICTASTLRLLTALLGTNHESSDTSEGVVAVKSAKQKHTTTIAASRSIKDSTKRINSKITILASPEVPIQCLPQNKRLALATNTFNKTLKNLGDALKAKQNQSYKKSGAERSPLKETQGRIRALSRTSKPDGPNKRLPQKSPELRKGIAPSTLQSADPPGLIATAECARTSLHCLRKLKTEDAGNKELDTQLEQAALALISKLQGLGLTSSAIEETLHLRKALDDVLRSHPGASKNGIKLHKKVAFSSLVDCIEFAEFEVNAKSVGLIASFQAQVLQLIVVDQRNSADEDLLQSLNPARPGSPCYMVLLGAERGWISTEKAALQLHSLSQSVLSFCPVPANGASDPPLKHGSPEAQFQLQCLALQMRSHWWGFANHQPNIDKEIWTPFHRFMLLLRRRIGRITTAHFSLMQKCLDNLLSLLSKMQHATKLQTPRILPSSAVMSALQTMAEATGLREESLQLLHTLDSLTPGLPMLQSALYHCKLATAILLDSRSSTETCIPTLEKAFGALDRPLKGTATELTELLLQATRLRKAAVTRLTAINEHGKATGLDSQDKSCLSSACIRIIFGVLHFVVRYIGFKPRGDGGASSPSKYSQISQQAELVARQSVRNALAGVQLCITHEDVGWESCISALSDCISVAERLNEKCQVVSETDFDKHETSTTFVKVSNMYWSWYLKQKNMDACTLDLLPILRGSIEALEGRTSSEKKTGFLAVKCEKAAMLYMETRQFHKARQVLEIAIAAHIQAEVLSTAARRTFTESPRQIWGETESSEFLLGRVLSAYARLLLKHQPDPSFSFFYDRAELKVNERALLIERQFVALNEAFVPENFHSHLKEAAEIVLSLYGDDAHSVHRLRFVSELLTFCSKCRLHPCKFLPEAVTKMCLGNPIEDSTLGQTTSFSSSNCLLTSVMLQWKLQTSKPSEVLLQEFLESHRGAIDFCESWTSLLPFINDPAVLMAQVHSVIDFSDMQGLSQIKLDALLMMRRLLEIQTDNKDESALTSCTTQIGLQYTRMGLTNKAGRALATAETFLKQSDSKTLIALQWHLAYAEYLTALSSFDKAADQLVSAQWRYEADFLLEGEASPPGSRLAQHKYLAQAAYIASMLAFENGDVETAVLYAKKSVKITTRQWTVLEKLLGFGSSKTMSEQTGSKVDELVDDLSNLTLSDEDTHKKSSGKAAAFWAYVQMHFDCLLHLSRLSAHQGSFQDAVFYAEQAKKVGKATGSQILLCRASSLLAVHLAEGGRLDASRVSIDQCSISWECMDGSAASFQASMDIASAHLATGDFNRSFDCVEQAYRAASRIHSNDNPSAASESQNGNSVKAGSVPKGGRSTGCNPTRARKRCEALSNAVNSGVHIATKGVPVNQAPHWTEFSTCLQRMQAQAHLLKSRLCIRSESWDDAGDLLLTVKHVAKSSVSDIWYHILQAALMLTEALRLLQSDVVYSVLAESTIAYPTRWSDSHNELPQEDNAPRNPTSTAAATPAKSSKRGAKKQASSQPELPRPGELMTKARELLFSASSSSSSLSGCSSVVSNNLSSLLTRLQLLSSLLSTATSSNPLQITFHLTAPKSLYWSRETASTNADIALATKSCVFEWPDIYASQEAAPDCTKFAFGHVALQQQLIDDLPPSWEVITVALSGDESEIFISRIRRSQCPFLLRLPLHRAASKDFDEEPFEFHTAKTELLDIIENANLTAHDAKASSDKRGKRSWWAAREALDTRLESLLNNIETLWFGGFRGIFSNQRYDEGLLSRFSESLLRVLNQQLASRRKTGTNKERRSQLHPHVLELFVALGNPSNGDLDDAITDLLYFVVDILQFQGERNAYDEIDFDAMVLEITDALQSYHDAVKDATSERRSHKILVLDRALHAFPWESLPCLKGQSVSRMPSLSCLQERLDIMRQKDATCSGLCINPQKGAYILNPSSDLKSTEQTFLSPFESTFADYTSIVNRAPSETEFETCLRDKELCLYFGHGSGGQFIRGRTIKRLKQCAVTFLMGCSSSKMVECGQFEPYGVPYNYLHAGCAAVVGTLWDVTDKDIDRFAMETFVNWGLLGQGAVMEDNKGRVRKLKNKGRARTQKAGLSDKHPEERPRKMVALDDAVARARDACLLRYLNGAAPVIYGIPVYLDDRPRSC